MHLTTRNVNSAFRELVGLFTSHANRPGPYADDWTHKKCEVVRRTSRNGDVLMIDEPVTITYTHPKERVLFNAARDANPFFHLYEALWMLAGRNDVAPVAYYCSRMGEFSDDGETLNGAYGHRWRLARDWSHQYAVQANPLSPMPALGEYASMDSGECHYIDQLSWIVAHLKADPTSRRAVLQMWNVEDDLLKIGPKCPRCLGSRKNPDGSVCSQCGGTYQSKDTCCNLSVMFSLRSVESERVGFDKGGYRNVTYLDMTVTNRSNDLLWGMLGANYVHFTFLQEYMAARLGVEVGRYHQFSNNLHVYCDRDDWKPEELLVWFEQDNGLPPTYKTIPLVQDPETFERELQTIVEQYSGKEPMEEIFYDYQEPFLKNVAQPMFDAFLAHKKKTNTALDHTTRVAADDWRIACTQWLERRKK